MKSNYKVLGKYVRLIDIRDTDLQIENLLGVNVSKNFMPSVANTIGTDMTNYKIVKKNQFACNPMHVGRDKIFPVAMLKDYDVALVSPAYFVFEIIDTNELLPDYLMMWFRRPETDHFMWFKTDSSVRGGIGWDEICSVELPVPDITEQQKIVDEYNVLCNRIALNEQMNQKLEETAQAIYKQWFVDFEFPDENGQPYKTSGGEFEESELGDIPKGWRSVPLLQIVNILSGGTPDTNNYEYWNGDIPFFTPKDIKKAIYFTDTEKHISQSGLAHCNSKLYPINTVFVTVRGTVGKTVISGCPSAMNQTCYAFCGKEGYDQYYVFQVIISIISKIKREASGAVFDALVTKDFDKEFVTVPPVNLVTKYSIITSPIYSTILNKVNQNALLKSAMSLAFSSIM